MKYYLEDHKTGAVCWIYEESDKGFRLAWSTRGGVWAPLQNRIVQPKPPWHRSSKVWFTELTNEELFALIL